MTGQCVILVLLYVFQASVSQIIFISPYGGSTVKGIVGSSVQFNWSFSGDVSIVKWGLTGGAGAGVFDEELYSITKFGSVSVTSLPAYTGRVSGNRTAGKAIFTLSKLERTDTGFYGCEISPTDPDETSIFDNVKLVVEAPPKIIHISPNQTVDEGDNVKLNCTADGNPSPIISWKRLSDNSEVTMPLIGIRRQDEGGYRCTASNGIGEPVSSDVFIAVQYKPKGVTISTNATRNTAKQGQNVALTCDVSEAKPPVSEYKFYLNDSILTPITNVNKFIIQGVKRSQHFGKYKCVAHNDAGDGHSDQVFLNIAVPAEIQWVTVNLTVNEGNPISLRCDTTGYPSPVVTWRKVGGQTYQGSVLHILNSTKMNSGTYVCEADNGEGKVEMKTFVTVQYQAAITSAKATETQSWIGQTVRLECVADGVPTPTITWKKPDGSEIKEDNIVDVRMEKDKDFGNYTCEAENGVGVTATSIVQVNQIKAPGSPSITVEIEATSLTVRWTAPDDDGRSPITGYQVIILQGGNVIENETTGASVREYAFVGLNRSTNYTVKVSARNKVFEGDASELKVKTKYEGPPAAVEMIDLPAETEETEVTLMWNEPQNNGAPITNYTVYQRNGAGSLPRDWIKIKEKTNLSDRKFVVQKLEKDKVYEFAVTATNKHGESLKAEKSIKKIKVLGDIPKPVVITEALNDEDGKITLKWKKPEENGAAIILYSKYQRIAGEEQWTNRENITDTKRRSYVFNVKKGANYEFVMTATNNYGESEKTNVQEVEVLADKGPPSKTSGGMGTAVVAGAAAAGVLLIVGLIILVVWWKRRKASADDGSSSAGLRNVNPDELDDGYHAVGAPSAARQLQACGRVPDATYAEVDMSQKTNRPVADVYAQVDKSKKPKKKQKKNPGELDYAELDDLRPNVRPAPPPSGANARPLVRAPAYEGTEYADITQFGAPQAEPTYGNVPKKDVVYSNVESM